MAAVLRANRRRARRALLWACGVFVIAQVAVGVLLDYGWPELRFPTAAMTLSTLRRCPRSPDIVCLGSSRLGAAFRPDKVQQPLRQWAADDSLLVFNACVPAGDLITADFMMERILAEGKRPALVIIEVSPEMLAERNFLLDQHVLRQFTWGEIPEHFSDICESGGLSRLLRARAIPLYVHRREICRRAYAALAETMTSSSNPAGRVQARAKVPPANMERSSPEENQGVEWDRLYLDSEPQSSPAVRQATLRGVASVRRWLKGYRVGGISAEALDRLVQRCQDHDIEVILVGAPLASAHRALYTPEIDQAYQMHLRQVAAAHHCQFIEYRDRLPDTLFLDNHHVLPQGALYFSRTLAREVLAPRWRARNRDPY